jgi:hypothetical protein
MASACLVAVVVSSLVACSSSTGLVLNRMGQRLELARVPSLSTPCVAALQQIFEED